MLEELRKKILEFFESGGEIYYHLKTDDYTAWIPVEIARKDDYMIFISLSDHVKAQVFKNLKDCSYYDFKFYKAVELVREKNSLTRMYLVLGDWSDDGHGHYNKVLVDVNKTVLEVQEAYKASCKLTGLMFNGNTDYTELDRTWQEADRYKICVEYCEQRPTSFIRDELEELNCPKEIIDLFGDDVFNAYIQLWFWFVKLSLPDLEYKLIDEKDSIPCINGYWDDNLNTMFGYGLFID